MSSMLATLVGLGSEVFTSPSSNSAFSFGIADLKIRSVSIPPTASATSVKVSDFSLLDTRGLYFFFGEETKACLFLPHLLKSLLSKFVIQFHWLYFNPIRKPLI